MSKTLGFNNHYRWLTLYLLCNFAIALVIATRFYQNLSIPHSVSSYMFGITHTIGHLGFLFFLAASPLYLLYKLTHHSKVLFFAAVFFCSFALILLLTDTFIFQQYRFHINAVVIELFFAGGSEIISFPITMWLMIVLIIGIFIASQFYLANALHKIIRQDNFPALVNKKSIRKVLCVIPLCFVASHLIHALGDAAYNRDITKQSKILPLAYPLTAKSLMEKYGLLNIEENKIQSLLKYKQATNNLNYPTTPLTFSPIENKPNIVMIIVDSWRADMMTESIMPNTFAFSKNSLNYQSHFSGSNDTRHGMFSLLYGIPGNYWDSVLKQQQGPVLIKTLLEQGYQAQIFASAKLTMPEFDQTLFVDIPNLRSHSTGETPWQRDENLTIDYVDWLTHQSPTNPIFSLLFFDSAHGFSLPSDYEKPFLPSLETINYLALDDDYNPLPFINLYKNTLHYIDSKIADILSALESKGDNTIIIITGDHGKEFNDSKQGYWGHNSNYSPFQTRVPLLIRWPQKQAKIITNKTSHLSIVPTLMANALGVTSPTKSYSSSDSLFEQTHEKPWVFMGRNGYYAINDGKQVYELDRLGNFTIFDANYQVDDSAKINILYVQEALQEMSRFYKQ